MQTLDGKSIYPEKVRRGHRAVVTPENALALAAALLPLITPRERIVIEGATEATPGTAMVFVESVVR